MDKPENQKDDPHLGQPVYTTGQPLEAARAVMVLLHGRGASAEDILTLTREFNQPDFAYLAPEASGGTWYPYPFLVPRTQNEPHLSSALAFLDRVVKHIQEAGIPPEKTILLGFSQGACLALDYAARHPLPYAGLVGLSGGLIGAENELGPYPGTLEKTLVFLGCSDVDPHIPKERVNHTAGVFQSLGAKTTLRLYPGMGHTVNQDEIQFVQEMMKRL